MKHTLFILCGVMLLSGDVLGAPRGVPEEGDEDGGDVEGDMLEPPEAGSKFSMLQHSFYKWPGGVVVYQWAPDLYSSYQTIIKTAMEKVENALRKPDGSYCIQFKPKTEADQYYLHVQNAGGCAAGIGRWPNHVTPVYIGPRCTVGNMMHEMLHTLGLYHEQSRNDRDDYVHVNLDHVKPGKENNFNKAGAAVYDQGTKYDYDSIMHYRSNAFTGDGSDTITVPAGAHVGQRDHLSVCDVERIQVHYGCKAKIVDCLK